MDVDIYNSAKLLSGATVIASTGGFGATVGMKESDMPSI